MFRSHSRLRSLVLTLSAAVLVAIASAAPGLDEKGMPDNLGGGLRELAAWHAVQATNLPPAKRSAAVQARLKTMNTWVQSDRNGRVVVDIHLDGTVGEADVKAALTGLGAEMFASIAAGISPAAKHGVLSAWLPVEAAVPASRVAGVQSILLVRKPKRHVGARTSQGVAAMRVVPVLRQKITGAGIKVGVISDSYDFTEPHASANVARGDLPGTGNRLRRTTPVTVLQDSLDPMDDPTDEGRAMLQIVHDVAPDAALAFCTAGRTQAEFANAIRRLRTEAMCDVIVDDIGFPDEPMFSDGVVAQAVEDVMNSTTLPGKKALYFSAAGNDGSLGYEADFAPVTDATARSGSVTTTLKLNQVPTQLTAGGFHNFTSGGTATIEQKLVIIGAPAGLNFQWNDLFDAGSITSDFNLLVFDANGNYLSEFSGTDNAFSTGTAQELVGLDVNPTDDIQTTYYVAITRRSGGSGEAQHFRYYIEAEGDVSGTFLSTETPTILGHAGPRSGDGVAAYAFNRLTRAREYTAFGKQTIYFDDQGNRLMSPEIRDQPTIAAPDGVATTVVGFSPFPGTSAAAPHAAAVAALLLDAAGGPGSLTPIQVRQALQSTARLHDLDPNVATARASTANGTVTVTGRGNDSAFSANNPDFFTLSFTGPTGSKLSSVIIDLTPAGLRFDQSAVLGLPFIVGSRSGGVAPVVNGVVLPGARKLKLTFANFPTGGRITFGIDRDLAALKSGGNSADQLVRGVVTSSILLDGVAKPVSQKASFKNHTGRGFTPQDGFGFIDAKEAVTAIPP